LRCLDDVLLVEGGEHLAVPVEFLDVSVGGFDDDTLFLHWQQAGVDYSLTLADADAQRALAAVAPPGLWPHINRGRRELDYHRNKWRVVLATLGLFGLLLWVAYWQSDAIIGWGAGKVSLETEQRIGNEMLAQLERDSKLTQHGLAADTVKSIGNTLTTGSRYHYRWYVLEGADVNAFAVPSGIIVVSSALIGKAATAEELAGVLAHEVAHVEQRHTLQQMIHTAGWAAVLSVALGDVSALAAVFVHQVGNLSYSRRLEAEADVEGIRILVQAGIQPDGIVRFFKALLQDEKRVGGANITLLSTHPDTADRLANLKALAESARCDCRALDVDWQAVQTYARQSSAREAASR
jgi:beta-barrel assembly-enhancing protease